MSVKIVLVLLTALLLATAKLRFPPKQDYSTLAKTIQDAVATDPTLHHASWNRLAYFVDSFGPRLWGGRSLELSIQELLAQLQKEGFENAHLEPVNNFTAWVRGEESLTLFSPRPFPQKMPMIGLGKSVSGNITADVVVVRSFDELNSIADKVKGKIVLFNQPWVNYETSVQYRSNGASQAAR